MRQAKNGSPQSGPNNIVEREDEVVLEQSYVNLTAALKQWRRHPSSQASIDLLVAAYDAKDDALQKVVDRDVENEQKHV